jgi:CheY-like chemotaxis protein
MTRVLIIEDDRDISSLLARIVNHASEEITESHTLAEGLDAARSNDYDIVFLDLTLPDGNGLSILPELAFTPSRPEIIIVTGTGDQRGATIQGLHRTRGQSGPKIRGYFSKTRSRHDQKISDSMASLHWFYQHQSGNNHPDFNRYRSEK